MKIITFHYEYALGLWQTKILRQLLRLLCFLNYQKVKIEKFKIEHYIHRRKQDLKIRDQFNISEINKFFK